MLDYYSHSEPACPTTDQVRLATGFGEALEKLRIKLDAPIYLTSACRSSSHNAKVNSHPRSLHLIVNGHWEHLRCRCYGNRWLTTHCTKKFVVMTEVIDAWGII